MLKLVRLGQRLVSLSLLTVLMAVALAATAVLAVPQMAAIATANEGFGEELALNELGQRSSMYAADGTFLTYLVHTEENREPVTLDQIPQPVIDAVLAVEDAAFYEHNGVNPRAVFRALVQNVNAGGITQGGSTITQQIVKNSLLTSDQNLSRKTTEAFYAMRLEQQMTKDEILERYLNTVYFGSSASGVQTAAEVYWGLNVEDLGWEHAALLAGLIRSPHNTDPTRQPDAARERRATVVTVLVSEGHITEAEGDRINASPIPDERQTPVPTQPTDYFVQEALDEVLDDESGITLGGDDESSRYNAVYFGGLKIYTTFEPDVQAMALAARDNVVPETEQGFTAAIASVETHTGAVKALVGGPGFDVDNFNLATQGLRQPGSSMKTFVLASLFEQGYTPADQVRVDRPCSFDNPGGEPDPYEVDSSRRGGGYSLNSLQAATMASNNCSFVRLGQVAGLNDVIDTSYRLGITTPLQPVMSLPLGVNEVHPIDMAAAYSTIANDGLYNRPYFVERVEDRDGNVIYEREPATSRSISNQSARMVTQVLQANVTGGTGTGARLDGGHIAAGKTGTTQNHEDAWFVGYTEYYTTAVWMGHPDLKVSMGRVFGGTYPAAIFKAFMDPLHEGLEPVAFPEPDPYSRQREPLLTDREIGLCDGTRYSTGSTVLVDSSGDGSKDCFKVVTTTTTAPEEPEEDGAEGEGGEAGGEAGGDGGGDSPPASGDTGDGE